MRPRLNNDATMTDKCESPHAIAVRMAHPNENAETYMARCAEVGGLPNGNGHRGRVSVTRRQGSVMGYGST